MNARDMSMELQLMMSRNLAILLDHSPNGIREGDVRDMLRAIAGNIAQIYAHRISDNENHEGANQ